MEDRTYKTRVELSMILEIDVIGCHEDNAGAISERVANDITADMVRWYESEGDGYAYIPSWGVRCTDVEPVDYEKGE